MKNIDKIYAQALYALLMDADDLDSIISGFLTTLKSKSLIHRVDHIIKEFEKIYNKKNDIANLKIKSAYHLDKDLITKIANALGIKEYELETEIDKDLIGGFVAQYDDNLIDSSLKNNLNKLHNQLTK